MDLVANVLLMVPSLLWHTPLDARYGGGAQETSRLFLKYAGQIEVDWSKIQVRLDKHETFIFEC